MSNKAQIREDARKLNPIDDALFIVMSEELDFCQEMLSVLLSDTKLIVLCHTPQKIMKNLQGRSCTLDLECILGDGRHVGVEVQKADDDDHQRRVRYDGSLLSTNIAEPGTKFGDVPDVIVIFISKFDIFGGGHSKYHVDRIVREMNMPVDNGFQEIYINASADDGTDIAELMKIFTVDNEYNDERFPVTSKIKRRFKETDEGVNKMCEIIEKYKNEGRAEGLATGRAEGLAEGLATGLAKGATEKEHSMIISMLKNKISMEQIINITGLTMEKITSIGKQAAVL